MRVIKDMRRTVVLLLAMIGLLVVVGRGPVAALSAEHGWFDAMMEAVLVEQAKEGPFWGTYAPYVAQLEVVRGHLLNDDTAAVYEAMNRLMDMLDHRENEIPPEVADWLFDYCYVVTPAKYHDVSRHIEKFIEHQFGDSIG